jgi:hypothetical protein
VEQGGQGEGWLGMARGEYVSTGPARHTGRRNAASRLLHAGFWQQQVHNTPTGGERGCCQLGADLAASARSSAVSLLRLATSVAVRGS